MVSRPKGRNLLEKGMAAELLSSWQPCGEQGTVQRAGPGAICAALGHPGGLHSCGHFFSEDGIRICSHI